MSNVISDLNLINEYKADIYNAIKNKGVDIPANTPLSNYADKVSAISGGGSSVGLVTPIKIDNNVIKGFTFNNYAQINQSFNLSTYDWEVCIAFKQYSLSEQGRIFAFGGSEDGYPPFGNALFGLESGIGEIINYWIASGTVDSSAWYERYDICAGAYDGCLGSTTVQNNIKYWFKLSCNKNDNNYVYTGQISTDGTNFTQDFTKTSNKYVSLNSENKPRLGTGNAPSTQTFNGEIYLDDCYIKINNQVVWHG